MRTNPIRSLLLSSLIISSSAFFVTSVKASNTIFQHLVEQDYSEMTLELNFDELFEQLKSEEEHQAQLIMKSKGMVETALQVKIKPRGVFRRYNCEIPPLRFNFSKKELEAVGLNAEYDKLKLVAPCFDDSESEQQLLKEYWGYKLYNEITPASFQVHLVRITYVNTGAEQFQKEHWAFFIEGKDELAHRLGGIVVDQYGTLPTELEPNSYQQTMLFNYMIGNEDWDLGANRNITLVQVAEDSPLILVPYDFDYSVFVSPSYLKGSKHIDAQGIYERVLIGQFEGLGALVQTAETFQQAEQLIIASFEDFSPLSQEHKRAMRRYLQDFFSLLENEKKLARQLL
ncbi:MAG: hypothetical protein HRU41_40785 [Saprospiraceae bacterium]|nr:hypothetical protein [Saprospiraceae bacterium]